MWNRFMLIINTILSGANFFLWWWSASLELPNHYSSTVAFISKCELFCGIMFGIYAFSDLLHVFKILKFSDYQNRIFMLAVVAVLFTIFCFI